MIEIRDEQKEIPVRDEANIYECKFGLATLIAHISTPTEHYTLDFGSGTIRVKPIITNADRIRAMTDEELAEWIGKVTAGGYGMCAPGHYDCEAKDSCAPCWLDWLKQEANK